MEVLEKPRHGTFSSSSIYRLLKEGKAKGSQSVDVLKYINEVKLEQKIGRALKLDVTDRNLAWGKLCEKRVDKLLGIEYRYVSKLRLFHHEYPWSGAPDFLTHETVADSKCPTPAEFFSRIEALTKGIETYKEEYPQDYWQLVSNSILLELNGIPTKYMEPIIYCPYQSELEAIREIAENVDDLKEQSEFYWISQDIEHGNFEKLSWIYEYRGYKNLNVFRFEIPFADKVFLKDTMAKIYREHFQQLN